MEAQSWRERRTRIDALKPELRKLAQGETTSELVEGASRLARSQRRQGQRTLCFPFDSLLGLTRA